VSYWFNDLSVVSSNAYDSWNDTFVAFLQQYDKQESVCPTLQAR
jgi:hypothetical protein